MFFWSSHSIIYENCATLFLEKAYVLFWPSVRAIHLISVCVLYFAPLSLQAGLDWLSYTILCYRLMVFVEHFGLQNFSYSKKFTPQSRADTVYCVFTVLNSAT